METCEHLNTVHAMNIIINQNTKQEQICHPKQDVWSMKMVS